MLAIFQGRYLELRRRLARRFGDDLGAEAAHDGCVRLALVEVRGIEDPFALALKVAANRATDLDRRRRLEAHLFADGAVAAPDQTEAGITAERVVAGRQAVAILRAALLELPPKSRTVLLLNRIQGHRIAAIAVRLGISERMVRKHLAHALQHCRRRLDEAELPGDSGDPQDAAAPTRSGREG